MGIKPSFYVSVQTESVYIHSSDGFLTRCF